MLWTQQSRAQPNMEAKGKEGINQMTSEDYNRARRLRRLAAKQGYALIKGGRRLDHNNSGGYMIAYGTVSPYQGLPQARASS